MASSVAESLPSSAAVAFCPIPGSDAAVDVSVLKAGSVNMPLSVIVETSDKKERFVAPVMCFLVEHQRTGQRVVFDLGIKTKLEDNPPLIAHFVFPDLAIPVVPERSIAEQLQDGKVDLATIQSVVYSHTHWDHVGNIAHFPSTTQLVLGPGSIAIAQPRWPDDPNGFYAASDIPTDGSRAVRELSQTDFNSDVGSFKAHDFFGDGSFYLLDAPGHIQGHIIALARTTVSPPQFILLGADAAHHRLLFTCCLAHGTHPHVGSFPNPATGEPVTMHADLGKAYNTMGRMTRMDEEPNVLVTGAHDTFFEALVNETGSWWPVKLNGWEAKGWKEALDNAVAASPIMQK